MDGRTLRPTMNDNHVNFWLRRIKNCQKLLIKRSRSKDVNWELRKLNEMERRLKQDRYMYWSYQSMIRDWTHPKPNFDPYYRKKINPAYLERSEPRGKNNATIRIDEMLEIRGAFYKGRNNDEDTKEAMGVAEEMAVSSSTA